jgi:hypothetical protein
MEDKVLKIFSAIMKTPDESAKVLVESIKRHQSNTFKQGFEFVDACPTFELIFKLIKNFVFGFDSGLKFNVKYDFLKNDLNLFDVSLKDYGSEMGYGIFAYFTFRNIFLIFIFILIIIFSIIFKKKLF